jgi:hypothetical protein
MAVPFGQPRFPVALGLHGRPVEREGMTRKRVDGVKKMEYSI